MAPSSPTVARWELTLRLRQRRLDLDIDVKTITRELGFSRNYWSAVENERATLADDKFAALLDLFSFDDQERKHLAALRTEARERGWWTNHPALKDPEIQRLYGLEHGAASVQTYEVLMITGLLQNEEYAHAVLSADPEVSEVSAKQLVDVRMRRQERLRSSPRLRLTALMSEGALLQQTGGNDGAGVLRRQLQHLVATIEDFQDSLEVRIVPFTTSPGGLVGASTLHILEFHSQSLPAAVWQESGRVRGFTADQASFDHISVSYPQTLESSLTAEGSLELIQKQLV